MHSGLQVAKARYLALACRAAARRMSSAAPLAPAPTYLSKEMEAAIPPAQLENFPQVGMRERVSHGRNGCPNYFDCVMFPYPAIRYGEWDAKYEALRQKEKGDWKNLSMEDKKNLYRHSFRYTMSETLAPTGRWKLGVAFFMLVMAGGTWTLFYFKEGFGPKLPKSFDDEWMMRSMYKQVMIGLNPVQGLGSKFDYENNRWKE